MNRDKSVDAYIASFDLPVRTQLRKLRSLIRRAAPDASEAISNGMPGYLLHGNLVWFAAIGQDVALYPRGHHFKVTYKAELKGYKTVAGAILFPSNLPLPGKLIARIVEDRVRENQLASAPTPAGIPEKLGSPARRALAVARITSLKTLARYSEKEILALHGMGPGSLPVLRAALQATGLKFRRDGQG